MTRNQKAKTRESIMNDLKNNLTYSMQRLALHLFQILVLATSVISASHIYAGTIFYSGIPATDSDANSGISTANQYTSAVDGGNTGGPDRVINGITLYALSANGQTSTADNCTVTVLAGTLANGGGSTASIQADGTLKDILASMTFNNDAGDNSQQEIVLDPSSLEPGATYDLRVYIGNSSGQNRQVNLAFAGDGQAPVETGFFNEDDATTSRGGFTDPNQAYYINYRYTWDGESTPGITITQKSASAPFCLYALTNQVVSSGQAAAPAPSEEGGLSAGFVNTESDQVGVASDDFYNSESLNKHGRWVKMDKWGASWQPTKVPSGWSPYTNGNFQYCDDCGWTFVSDEPWAWATYHYGRWARVHSGCGWAWVPGKVWAGSWVSWRSGGDNIGWAPLPPQAGCELGVGVSTWADREYDIGPDYYNFINIRDFGSDSYSRGGLIFDRGRNVTIINQTINITNIAYNRSITFAGGPNFFSLNQQIQTRGGRGIATVNVNRFADMGRFRNGGFAYKQGNQLALLTPRIQRGPVAHTPKIAETLGPDKIDKGWPKDPKIRNDLRKHIADQTGGQTPKTTRATVPPDVAQNVSKKHGGPQQSGGPLNQHPGPKQGNQQGQGGPVARGSGNAQHPGGPFNQHPGRKQGNQQGQGGPVAQGSGQGQGGPKHPKEQGQVGQQGQGGPVAQGGGQGQGGPKHPKEQGQVGQQGQGGPVAQGGGQGQGGPKHPKEQGQVGQQGQGGPVAHGGGQGQGGPKHPKEQGQMGQQGQGGPVAQGGGQGQGGPKHPKEQGQMGQQGQGGPVAQGGGQGQGGPKHPKERGQMGQQGQ